MVGLSLTVFQADKGVAKTAVPIGEQIDRISRIVSPSTFMMFVIVYFFYYFVIVDGNAESIKFELGKE